MPELNIDYTRDIDGDVTGYTVIETPTSSGDTHKALVVRVGEILPHPNADKLEITKVNGYQLVVGKGFKPGDLAVFIQPDSIVPQTEPFSFVWAEFLKNHPEVPSTDIPERRRRITVRRFRGEYSEGLLLPITDFAVDIISQDDIVIKAGIESESGKIVDVSEGSDVSELLGVTHYVPEFDREKTTADIVAMPRKKYPRTLKGWFYFILYYLGIRQASRGLALHTGFDSPYYDIAALKNHPNWFADGEVVTVTEKIHGSNARYVVVDDQFFVGSRTQWKRDGDNVWWNAARQHPEIEEWCRQNPKLFLYGEVGPTQKGYRYGCDDGETFFFGFDVYDKKTQTWHWPGNLGFGLLAPGLYVGPYDSATIKALAEGDTVVPGAKGIREGVVVSALDRRQKLKVVSNKFLEKDNQ